VKKLLVCLSILLVTSCTQANVKSETNNQSSIQIGKVVDCKEISSEKLWTGGISLDCLDKGAGAQLGALRGPMIINVWGSWCAPCVEEMPHFVRFYEKAKGVIQLVGVNVEEANLEAAQEFVVNNGITWPNLYDSDGRSRQYFGLGVPVTWFISAEGDIVYKHIGVINSESELIDLTQKYLGIKI
jgi:thiol-disulfide isomerase/thioredoxin